jgi:hypothetical protein
VDAYEGPAEIYIEARLLAEANKASFSIKGNNNQVFTMRKGLAGKSDGATTSEATIESAIPRKGMEFDFRTAVLQKRIFTIVVKSGNQRVQFQGWFESADWANAVDAATMQSAQFIAGAPKILGA